MGFRASNNEAKCKALIIGLKAEKKLDARVVEISSDSCLIVNQVEGSFEARYPWMAKYLKLVGILLSNFHGVKVSQISRGQNGHANSLAILASSMEDYVLRIILVVVLNQPSIGRQLSVFEVSTPSPSWINPIASFMTDGVLSSKAKKEEKVRRMLSRFCLSNDKRLYQMVI